MMQKVVRVFAFWALSLTILLSSQVIWAKDAQEVKLKEGIVLAAFGQ